MFQSSLVPEQTILVPGRANLIGEHIDYHGLPVLPIALSRAIRVRFTARDRPSHRGPERPLRRARVRMDSATRPGGRGRLGELPARRGPNGFAGDGDWAAASTRVVESDLPPAAGLSSSSALIVAFTLALLRANGRMPPSRN